MHNLWPSLSLPFRGVRSPRQGVQNWKKTRRSSQKVSARTIDRAVCSISFIVIRQLVLAVPVSLQVQVSRLKWTVLSTRCCWRSRSQVHWIQDLVWGAFNSVWKYTLWGTVWVALRFERKWKRVTCFIDFCEFSAPCVSLWLDRARVWTASRTLATPAEHQSGR